MGADVKRLVLMAAITALVCNAPAAEETPQPTLTIALDGPLEFGKTVLLKHTEYGSPFVEPRSFMLTDTAKGPGVAITLRFRGPEVVPVRTMAVEVVLEDKSGKALMRGTKMAGDARPGARRPKRLGSATPAVSSATTVSLPLDPKIREQVWRARIRFVERPSSPKS